VGQFGLPVGRDQARLGDGVNVIGQRERYHVRFQAVNHGTALFARSAVRLLNRDILTGLLFPVRRELLIMSSYNSRVGS
jgi:hypothetical protein